VIARPILDATTYHHDRSAKHDGVFGKPLVARQTFEETACNSVGHDTPAFRRVERLARELRREIELGIHMGEIDPNTVFDIIVLRANDEPALRGRFDLRPFKPKEAA
jgi:hypothetical protein